MSDDIPDIPAPVGQHYPDQRNPSQNRPCPTAPEPISHEPINIDFTTVAAAIEAAEHIQKIGRSWRYDPAWPPIYRRLSTYQRILRDMLVEHPGSFELQFYQAEVKRVLDKRLTFAARVMRSVFGG